MRPERVSGKKQLATGPAGPSSELLWIVFLASSLLIPRAADLACPSAVQLSVSTPTPRTASHFLFSVPMAPKLPIAERSYLLPACVPSAL